MTNHSSPKKPRHTWSKRLKTALAGLALAGVLFSGAAAVSPDQSNSDETARSSTYVSVKVRFETRALTWS